MFAVDAFFLQQEPPFLQHAFFPLPFPPSCAKETPLTKKAAVAKMKNFFMYIFLKVINQR